MSGWSGQRGGCVLTDNAGRTGRRPAITGRGGVGRARRRRAQCGRGARAGTRVARPAGARVPNDDRVRRPPRSPPPSGRRLAGPARPAGATGWLVRRRHEPWVRPASIARNAARSYIRRQHLSRAREDTAWLHHGKSSSTSQRSWTSAGVTCRFARRSAHWVAAPITAISDFSTRRASRRFALRFPLLLARGRCPVVRRSRVAPAAGASTQAAPVRARSCRVPSAEREGLKRTAYPRRLEWTVAPIALRDLLLLNTT